MVAPGDLVVGTVPMHIGAAVCERGATLLALEIDQPEMLRGSELSADQLDALGARLCRYDVRRLPT